jgi:predicted  nucleic acid-binding Zn-ribbon protein
MYASNKQREYDPYLQDFGSKQVGINQALNDRMKVLEMQNSALHIKLKKLEEMIEKLSINTNEALDQKLEEMTDKLDDLESRIDLLDE